MTSGIVLSVRQGGGDHAARELDTRAPFQQDLVGQLGRRPALSRVCRPQVLRYRRREGILSCRKVLPWPFLPVRDPTDTISYSCIENKDLTSIYAFHILSETFGVFFTSSQPHPVRPHMVLSMVYSCFN
jgi:hypothetical protein